MLEKVVSGNEMSIWFFGLLRPALRCGLVVWIENPAGSWMFKLPEFQALLKEHPELLPWTLDYCRFGTRWRKRTKIFSTTALGGQRTLCRCPKDRPHLLLRGRSKVDRMNWTREAQAYPRGVCRALSFAICLRLGKLQESQRFSLAECAKCDNMRIGEAANPGPRWRRTGREGVLSDFALVEPKTELLQNKIWEGFLNWLRQKLSKGAMKSVLFQPMLAVVGNELYSSGGSLFTCRHLVVFAQKHLLVAKPYMSPLWDQISRWELQEPTVDRTPLPEVVFRAMMAVSLSWDWVQFGAAMGIAYYGISRPGEVIREVRKNLLLPSDLLDESRSVCYLRLIDPKSRRRGRGRLQHLCFNDEKLIAFLEKHYQGNEADSPIYSGSASAFRRRWDRILGALFIPQSANLTPGSLRGGGAVRAWRDGVDLPQLMFKMRLKQQSTLESYLQEVAADLVLPSLSQGARNRISAASSLYDALLSIS